MNRHTLPAVTAAALLTLAACAADEPAATGPSPAGQATTTAPAPTETTAEPTTEPEFYGPGTYDVTAPDGGTWTIAMPADAPEGLEAHREALGIPAKYYIRIDIDNTAGTDRSGPSHLSIVDRDGNTYEYASPTFTVADWGPQWTIDDEYLLPDGSEITEQEYWTLSEANDRYLEELDTAALPGARATRYMIGDDPVPDEMVYGEVVEALEPTPIFPAPEAEPTNG